MDNQKVLDSWKVAGKREMTIGALVKRDKYLIIMFLPIFLYYLIFHYLPLAGIIMAFKNFVPGHLFFGGTWVGFKWFEQFFTSIYFWRLLRNTFLLAFYPLIFGFPIPILFAICITEIKSTAFKRLTQTITYLPYFISTVVIAGILVNFLSMSDGIINIFLENIGLEKINFMMSPDWFRSIFTISGVWQTFGFNSIIFIAAIMSTDQEIYEYAKIDGVNKFQEVWHITLPSIKPTIIILLILALGGIMNVGFEKVYLLYNPGIYETSDVISTYVYRQGIETQNYGYAAAVGLFNSVITFILVYSTNMISRKANKLSLW